MTNYVISAILCALTSHAAAQGSAQELEEFVYSHQVRDYHGNCPGKQECRLVDVTDVIVLRRGSGSMYDVTIQTTGHDLHVCEFVGKGRRFNKTLQVKNSDPYEDCKIEIKFFGPDTVGITKISKACSNSCGANASFFTEKLRKRHVDSQSGG